MSKDIIKNNLTYTKEEQEKYGLSNMDDYFNSIDLEMYMDLETKKENPRINRNQYAISYRKAKEK